MAVKLHRKLTDIAKDMGYHGMLTIIPAKLKAMRTVQLTFRRLGIGLQPIADFQQHMALPERILKRLSSYPKLEVIGYRNEYRESCLDLLLQSLEHAPLTRLPEEESVDFILKKRAHTRTWLAVENGNVAGLLNVIHAGALSPSDQPNHQAQIEYYCCGRLNIEKQLAFLHTVFTDDMWKTTQAIHLPPRAAISEDLIKTCGFIKAPSHYKLFYANYDPGPVIKSVDQFDLDVF